jgi:quercetin dioxygenase-like cupin family protein
MKRVLLLGLAGLIAATPAAAKTAELKWMDGPPGLPGGAQFAVVSGDPAKAGKFTIRIRTPANYSVPPHWHPSDEHVTLISGKLAYGMSDRFDRANATALSPGSSIVMKAKMNHWVFTADGAEVQISATGPFAITYANPADDPRPKPAAAK